MYILIVRSGRGIMRINTAIVLALALILAASASGCSGIDAEPGSDGDEDQARLEVKGARGIGFSGSCTVGDQKPTKLGGEVPKSFTYQLQGRPLHCEISSDGGLRVVLAVGSGDRSVQSISGGTLNLTYEDGSISSVTTSSSRSGSGGGSSSSQVMSTTTGGQGLDGEKKEPTDSTKESRNVGGFEEVELRGIGDLSIRQTGSESLTIEAENDVLPKLESRVVGDRLLLGPESGADIHTREPIDYELTVKNLSALEVLGAARVEADDIETARLAVTISGAGNVDTAGEAGQQEIDITGSGIYQAEDLHSKEVEIDIIGAGSAVVNVSEDLDAGISGVGSVEYIGDPAVKQDMNGAGVVSKRSRP
jgi:hypothetical protein